MGKVPKWQKVSVFRSEGYQVPLKGIGFYEMGQAKVCVRKMYGFRGARVRNELFPGRSGFQEER